MKHALNRRSIIKGSAMIIGLTSVAVRAEADVVAGKDGFTYEITRTEAEWRARLGDSDYSILREGKTEVQSSSPLWEEFSRGQYACKGCDLPVYSSNYKVKTKKGWLFYRASEPNSLLMNIDGPETPMDPILRDEMLASDLSFKDEFVIEVHCRRCGSHMGHILMIEQQALHCINGVSLTFEAKAA